jgi:hypothetical protein
LPFGELTCANEFTIEKQFTTARVMGGDKEEF